MKIESSIFLLLMLPAVFGGTPEVQAGAYTLTTTANHGSVSKYPDQASYDAGTVVRLVPRPDVGYSFRSWSGDVSSKALVATVTMNSNKSIMASFGTWEAPIGIPDPNFGITQTYRMYDAGANPNVRNEALTYTQNAEGGYYTHYIDNTSGNSTDSSTQANITDYTDHSNRGSPAKPRKTVPIHLPPGSVVEVHGGPYTYSSPGGNILISADGTVTQPIFIRGYDSAHRIVVTHPGMIGWGSYTASCTIIENLDFYNSVLEGEMYVWIMPPSHHIVMRNCDIHGVHAGSTAAGIIWAYEDGTNYVRYSMLYGCRLYDVGYLDADTDKDYYGFVIGKSHHNWFVDNEIYNAMGGVQINATNQPDPVAAADLHHNYVGRNVIHDCLQAGVWIKNGSDVIFSQNDIYHMRVSAHNTPSIGTTCAAGSQYGPFRVWYLFNRFHDSDFTGVFCPNADVGDNVYYIGNLMYGTKNRAFTVAANEPNFFLVNNTIYDVNDGLELGQTTRVTMHNNILSKIRDTSKWHVNVYYGDMANATTLTRNILYQPSGSVRIGWGSESPVYDVAGMQAVAMQCTGNLEANPLFTSVDTNDFSLAAGSPAIDAGTESSVYDTFYGLYGINIEKDIEGNPRTGTWDIGAYECLFSALTNLSVSGTSQNSVTLIWTVPGKNGVAGQPTRYDIRYAGGLLTEANWDTATQVQGEPIAGDFGTQQSFTITGLNPGTTYYAAIKVGDDAGHTSGLSPVVSGTTASSGNHAPVLVPIGDRSVVENGTLIVTVSATDADGDALTFSGTNLPAGAGFTPATRMFTWTPTNLPSGRYRVTFQVGDGQVTVSETITITVGQVANHAPMLAGIGNKSVNANTSMSFSVSATDPDGDALSFSATGLPSGARFVGQAFNWIPSYDQAGSYSVTFTVSDGQLTTSEQITITVVGVPQGSDLTVPVARDFYPAPDAIQAPLNPLIALTISDDGSGVDASTVAIWVNDQLVYSGDSSLYESAYGACRRTGTRASYRYHYRPAEPFDFSRQVSVRVNASDAAHNAMTPVSYQFVTQMHSFGRNQPVSSSSEGSGHPATATDSQGNIWAAWHAGQAGARDIYVAKRSSQGQPWDAPLRLTNLGSDQCNPAIAIGSDDALYIAWQGNRRGNWDIYVAVRADGSTWQNPVRVTDSNDSQTNPVIATDHTNPYHVFIAWEDNTAGNQGIFLASSSASLGGKTITRITSNAANQTNPALAVGSDNTVYLVWTDQRNGSADIYGSSSSVSSWANVPIATGPSNQRNPAIAVEPGTARLHMLWVDNGAGNLDILYGTSEGLPGSPLSGNTIIDDSTNADQSAPVIATARDHGNNTHIYACWQDNRSVGDTRDSDLYFVEIRSGTGGTNILVGDDGTNSNQSDPALGSDEHGQPVILWADGRSSSPGIYSAHGTYFNPVALASAPITRLAGGRAGKDPASITGGGDVSIQIPSYACDCDTVLSISEIRNPPGFTASCMAGYEIGPSGTQFSFPATVTIPYMSSGSGRATSYWYDAQTSTLSQQGMTEITNRVLANGISVISFKTTHLTAFYILESPISSGAGGPVGGGCALSHSQKGTIVEYLFPYAVLALYMVLLRCRDRRRKGDSGTGSSL